MTSKPMPMLTPAEAVAASACFISRLFPVMGVEFRVAQAERIHAGRCRFCDTGKDELLAQIERFNTATDVRGLDEWDSLSHAARWSRIKEAQEPPWWEEAAR